MRKIQTSSSSPAPPALSPQSCQLQRVHDNIVPIVVPFPASPSPHCPLATITFPASQVHHLYSGATIPMGPYVCITTSTVPISPGSPMTRVHSVRSLWVSSYPTSSPLFMPRLAIHANHMQSLPGGFPVPCAVPLGLRSPGWPLGRSSVTYGHVGLPVILRGTGEVGCDRELPVLSADWCLLLYPGCRPQDS